MNKRQLREHLVTDKETEFKDKTAVAIRYDVDDVAPKIIATGKGYLAEKIINQAKQDNVPAYRDDKLAKTLSGLEIGDMIPKELYAAVAEILVFVDDMEKLRNKLQ